MLYAPFLFGLYLILGAPCSLSQYITSVGHSPVRPMLRAPPGVKQRPRRPALCCIPLYCLGLYLILGAPCSVCQYIILANYNVSHQPWREFWCVLLSFANMLYWQTHSTCTLCQYNILANATGGSPGPPLLGVAGPNEPPGRHSAHIGCRTAPAP